MVFVVVFFSLPSVNGFLILYNPRTRDLVHETRDEPFMTIELSVSFHFYISKHFYR
jgi:hypothetical protein